MQLEAARQRRAAPHRAAVVAHLAVVAAEIAATLRRGPVVHLGGGYARGAAILLVRVRVRVRIRVRIRVRVRVRVG